jgi:hypothetical protein
MTDVKNIFLKNIYYFDVFSSKKYLEKQPLLKYQTRSNKHTLINTKIKILKKKLKEISESLCTKIQVY